MRLIELEKFEKITIQCHDNPDADALASGYGLLCYFKSKGKDVRLVYSGGSKIQKSNLRLMVEKLGIPIEYIPVREGETVLVDGLLITVDCQYGSGNVTGLVAEEVAVIDHHQLDHEAISRSLINSGLGSCATLVWKLLQEAQFDIDSDEFLGTALYYGLYTDTNQFSELHNPLDMDMREAVNADMGLITLFRNSNLSLKELEIAGIALIRYSYNDDYEFAVIKAQPCDPNILGLISDFLLQVDVIKSCVVFNEVNGGYKFSVRSCIREVNASELAAYLAEGIGSGGGHYEKAGGFVSLMRYEEKFPTLHTEGYFNNRMTQYFDSFDLIYAEDHEVDLSLMKPYVRRRLPFWYVKLDELLPVGSPITIRTLAGDVEMNVEENLHIVFGSKGDIVTVAREDFQDRYEPLEEIDVNDYLGKADYIPVIKNRNDGGNMMLTDYAKGCMPAGNEVVYARPLEKGAKVFTLHDKNRYQSGKPGDYLIARSSNLHDIYIVEQEIFAKNYDAAENAATLES